MKFDQLLKRPLSQTLLRCLSGSFLTGLCLCGDITQAAEASQKQAPKEAASYGELMIIEKQETPTKAWQVEVSGMEEFSNPYLNVHGYSASVKKSVGHFLYIGPEFTGYVVSESTLSKQVSTSLRSDAIRQNVFEPRSSMMGVASVIPVSGELNLFNQRALPFELEFTFGYGAVQYKGKKPSEGALLWRVGPRAFFTTAFGMQIQFGQEVEAPLSGAKITKSHGRLGFITRF